MSCIFSRWCCSGRRYATRNRRRAPSYQVPQSGEQTRIFSRELWAGRAEVHLQADVTPDETSHYDEEYSVAGSSTTTTAATSTTATASPSTTATNATATATATATSTTATTTPATTASTATTCTNSTKPSSTRGGQNENLMHRIKLVLHLMVSYLERVLHKKETGGGGIFWGHKTSKRRANYHSTKKYVSRRRTRVHRDRNGRIRRRHHSVGAPTSVTDNVGHYGNDGTTFDAADKVDNNIKRKIGVLEVTQEKLRRTMVERVQRKIKALRWWSWT